MEYIPDRRVTCRYKTAIHRTPNDLQLDDIVGAELAQVLQEGKDPVQAAADAEAEALKRIPDTTG